MDRTVCGYGYPFFQEKAITAILSCPKGISFLLNSVWFILTTYFLYQSRIMLHFPLEKFYPLAILFEDAIILGAENDTILFNASNISTTHLPYCILERSVSESRFLKKNSSLMRNYAFCRVWCFYIQFYVNSFEGI